MMAAIKMTSRPAASGSSSARQDTAPGTQTLCYCLGITADDLEGEYASWGRCSSRERIRELVRDGLCACTKENPSGTCCLGAVDTAIRRLQATVAFDERWS